MDVDLVNVPKEVTVLLKIKAPASEKVTAPELFAVNVPSALKVPVLIFICAPSATEIASSAVIVFVAISIIPSVTVTASNEQVPPNVTFPEALVLLITKLKLGSTIAGHDSPSLLAPLNVIFSVTTEPPAVPINVPELVKSPPIVKSSSPAPEFNVASD